jgi:two-component system LytT family sensor kinase
MQNGNFIQRYKLHHVFFWVLILGLWYFLRYEDFSTPQLAFRITVVKVLDLALMVYISNYILIPVFLYKRRYALFAFFYISMILVSSVIKMNILAHLMHNPQLFSLSGNLKARIYDNVIPHFFLVTAGAAVKLIFDYTGMQQRLASMAKEKAEAELHFLKSQINPHFLFNSLNSVYFLIDKENTTARKALHTFSEMLRFQLYGMEEEKIPIEKEIGYLEDYISLQRLRLSENSDVQFTYDPAVQGFRLEPLLLMPLVENAFKHLSHYSPERRNEIIIGLSKNNGTMRFVVENTREEFLKPSESGGIGLVNVKRRLQLLYPGKHSLVINEHPDRYKVEMKLSL